jgi:hypothetical protein
MINLDYPDDLVSMIHHLPVSPASPLYAIKLCRFRLRVLSSVALRTVGPRIAALEAAMMVKSLPVMPRRTSMMMIAWKLWEMGGEYWSCREFSLPELQPQLWVCCHKLTFSGDVLDRTVPGGSF